MERVKMQKVISMKVLLRMDFHLDMVRYKKRMVLYMKEVGTDMVKMVK
jgi:hypothetical protein